MCIAAAEELVKCAEVKGLSDDNIIPKMDEPDIYARVAVAVGMKAIEQGIARQPMTRDQLFKLASETIARARKETQLKMQAGIIAAAPK